MIELDRILNEEYRAPVKQADLLDKTSHSLSNIKKLEQSRGAEIILNAAQEQIEKEENKLQEASEKAETNPNSERKKDVDRLLKSENGISERKLIREIAVWTEKQAFEAWSKLLDWVPRGPDAADNIRDLKNCYTMLLENIMNFESMENQTFALARLQEALFQALNHILDQDMSDLFQFLYLNSEKEAVSVLMIRLYEMITGRPSDLFVQQKIQAGKFQTDQAILNEITKPQINNDSHVVSVNKNRNVLEINGEQSEPELLFCYTPAGQKEKFPVFFSDKSSALLSEQLAVKMDGSILMNKDKIIISEADFKNAILFVKLLKNETYVFSILDPILDQETMIGIRTGILSLKWEVFYTEAKVGKDMAEILKTAIDKFLFYSIQKESIQQIRSHEISGKPNQALRQKQIFLISETILKFYLKSKNPADAILKGLDFVYKTLLNKNNEYSNQQDSHTPLFLSKNQELKLEQQQKELFQCIRENWNQFITAACLKRRKNFIIEDFSKYQSIWLAGSKGEISYSDSKNKSISSVTVFVVLAIMTLFGGIVSFYDGSGNFLFLVSGFLLLVSVAFYFIK